jgi:uncharacterized membrane protein
MLKSFGLLVLFIAIAYFHIPKLAKEKLIREIWIFSILMLVITVISIAQVNGVKIPNPLELITITLDPLIKLF